MNKLSKRAISIIVIATFLISMIPIMPASAAATTWYVGALIPVDDPAYGNSTHNFLTIDYAIGQASAGDTIMVAAGAYSENVDVDKSLTLIGAGSSLVTVTALDTDISVFIVSANDVDISGFKATGAGWDDGPGVYNPNVAGIYIDVDVSGCTISDNILVNNYDGIYLGVGSHHNTLTSNDVSHNGQGFEIVQSDYNIFTENIANENWKFGFKVESGSYNIFIDNVANLNDGDAHIEGLGYASGNGRGFYLSVGSGDGNNYNIWMDNTANLNLEEGFHLHGGTGNTLIRNTFAGNVETGILLQDETTYDSNITDLSLYNNTITGGATGILIDDSVNFGVDDVTSWKVHYNNFDNVADRITLGTTAGTLDAELNYWGLVTGPATGVVSADVDFTPWLTDLVEKALAPVVFEGDVLSYAGTGVASGSTVKAFWDTATGTGAQLLNTTTGNPDGSYDYDIEVPSDVEGYHYIWVNDGVNDPFIEDTLYMAQIVTLDPDSGLGGDEVTVEVYGFSPESDVTIAFQGDVQTETAETDEYGYGSYSFDIPTAVFGDYIVTARDSEGFAAYTDYTVGASISLTPDEGPTGSRVTVEGRGWTSGATISFTLGGSTTVEVVDDDTITVGSNGEFTADVIIPGLSSEGKEPLKATESGGVKGPASEKFDITGLAEIEIDPTYGAPGAIVTVTGVNFTQVAGTEVYIVIDGVKRATAETNADGTFEESFVSPAIEFETYDVFATDEYSIDADDKFKVGLIALIINPVSGEAGTAMSLTGIGFEDGVYNLTFGDKLYEEYEDATAPDGVVDDAITDTFYIPNVEPGVYTLTVIDTAENELSVIFTVTESTTASVDPAVAPNLYNVSISGTNFADIEGAVEFVIYNSTEDWTMNVDTDPGSVETATDDDGNFTGHWHVPDDETLSVGDYTINVTGSEGLLVQLDFSVVAARVSVAPRKALFARGDTVSFDISNDFDLPDSTIEIYSPDDTLYWITDPFTDDEPDVWVVVDDLYTVPYYSQTANSNPMELASDAPLGTWLYIMYYDGDELMNGTFVVGPSAGAQIDKMLEAFADDIADDLADDMAAMSDDFADEMADLSSEIAGVASDLSSLGDDIVGDLAGDIADATDAGNAALNAVEDLAGSMSDLGDAVGDIADIAGEAAEAAQYAADAADDAVTAAEDAKGAASGLTTLVYGAIGASLIAALAAIVSLMQISKKIAG